MATSRTPRRASVSLAPAHASAVPAAGQSEGAVIDRWVTRITVVLAAAFVLIGIGTPLLGTTVFAGSDLFLGKAPWKELVPTGFRAQNPYVGDTVDSNIPQAHEFAERLRDGDFASWWSRNSGGAQLGSVPNDSLLSPLSLPYVLLPTALAPGYAKLLELAAAIGGMFLFTRRLGLTRSAAVVGGIVFASSGFMVAWTNWPHTKTAAFIPLLFWSVERLAQRRSLADLVPVGLVVAALLLGGFPAVAGYALMAAAVYLVVRVAPTLRREPGRSLQVMVLALGGVALGVGVAAYQLLAFVQELGAVAVTPRTQSASSHSPVESMITMLAPEAFGGTNVNVSAVSWFGRGHPIEELSYVGAAALVLVLVAAVARRRPGVPRLVTGFFLVAAVGAVVVIYLGGPLLAALQQLPVFDTNRIGRARSMLGFFVAVLAAIGFDALLRSSDSASRSPARRWAWRAYAVAVFGAVAAAAYAAAQTAHQHAFVKDQLVWFDAEVREAAVLGVCAVVAAVLARAGRGLLRGFALVALSALVVGQALMFVLPFWPRVAPEHFYPSTPTHEFLAAEIGSDRLVAAGAMQTGTEAYYGLRTVGGRAFVTESYEDVLRAWCDECFVTGTYLVVPPRSDLLDDPLLDRLGTRLLVMDPAAPVAGVGELVGSAAEKIALAPGRTVTIPVTVADTGSAIGSAMGGGLRAVGVVLAEPFAPSDPWASIEVVARDARGAELARTQRRFFAGAAAGPFNLALPEVAAAATAGFDVTLSADRPLVLAATAGVPDAALVRAADDGLRLAYSGGAVVYERLTALPRIRWASRALVETDPDRALRRVLAGTSPELVLSAPGPAASGAPAEVRVVEDSGDVIEVAVDADGPGYLVVADGLQDRWSARLDGREVLLRDADVGYVAVEVPAGEHRVRLSYEEPFGGIGLAVTAGALGALAAVAGLARWRRRRSTAT